MTSSAMTSPQRYACRILADVDAPAAIRLEAARWLLRGNESSVGALTDGLLSSIDAEMDDALWATIVELLAHEHSDVSAVWLRCRAGMKRCTRLPPRRSAQMFAALVNSGISSGEVATDLVSAIGIEAGLPVLIWLFVWQGQPTDMEEPTRSLLRQGIAELERSTLLFHLVAICDRDVREALGHSAVYTRYRSLCWTLQDWPYSSRGDLAPMVRRGVVSGLLGPAGVGRQYGKSGAGDS